MEMFLYRLPRTEKSTPKTFYFGMDEALSKESRNSVDQQMHHIQSRLQVREINRSNEYNMEDGDEVSSNETPTLTNLNDR